MAETISSPIWKDVEIELIAGGGDKVPFTVQSPGGKVYYKGNAYTDVDGEAYVRINDILADNIAQALPVITREAVHPMSASRSFEVQARGTTVANVNVWLDTSGDYDHDNLTQGAAAPIFGKAARNHPVMWTTYKGAKRVTVSYWDKNGTVSTLNLSLSVTSYGNVVALPSLHPDAVRMAIDDGIQRTEWDIVEACHRYSLYYLNAYGGWDFLLITGNDRRTDSYTRTEFARRRYNPNRQSAGTVVLRNEVQTKRTLVTGWLTDEQAANMHHLLGSTMVYLFDAVSQSFTPVVIENDSCEFKTYRNNGNALVSHTITVRTAYTNERR